VSIAAGAVLINVVSYQLMLVVIAVVIGACAAWLLARPARLPQEQDEDVPSRLTRVSGPRPNGQQGPMNGR
jgi:hypothetical protein